MVRETPAAATSIATHLAANQIELPEKRAAREIIAEGLPAWCVPLFLLVQMPLEIKKGFSETVA